jgi:tagatose 1,6-diphosphate aldolase
MKHAEVLCLPGEADWVDDELRLEIDSINDAEPAKGKQPSYEFRMVVAGEEAGRIRLRIGSGRELEMYAGHFGYEVHPAFRGRRYAERACRLLLPLARRHGMTTVWITCNPENLASRRTCERLGAVLVEIVPLPEESDMYRRGDRQKCRYRLDLS